MFGKLRKTQNLNFGAFGEVRVVRERHSKAVYALKVMRKTHLMKSNQIQHIKAEREILASADNPW